MASDFKDIMSKRTDEELVNILTINRQDYQPFAIEAAEEEIKTRNIGAEKIEFFKSDLVNQLEEKRKFDSKKVNSLKRLVHFVVDTIICCIISAIMFFFIDLLFGPQKLHVLFEYLIMLLCFFGYYVFMETKYQRTIGKFITSSLVVTKDEDVPDLKYIITRTICRFIPFDALSFLFSSDGFHDRFSSTTLIKYNKNS
ncbi:RDD family protein [Pedobacter nototheniae]|uniref:RDD family protein n=1 Tax=Pedobacter nototheniae TaxID=2488994 RepID=UPI00103D31F4|nr:RDD family protein [Pedobacter nototheniae]